GSVDDRAQEQGEDLVGAVSDDDALRIHAEEVRDLLADRSRRRIGVEPEALARAGDCLLDPRRGRVRGLVRVELDDLGLAGLLARDVPRHLADRGADQTGALSSHLAALLSLDPSAHATPRSSARSRTLPSESKPCRHRVSPSIDPGST